MLNSTHVGFLRDLRIGRRVSHDVLRHHGQWMEEWIAQLRFQVCNNVIDTMKVSAAAILALFATQATAFAPAKCKSNAFFCGIRNR